MTAKLLEYVSGHGSLAGALLASIFDLFRAGLVKSLIQDVPEELSVCEFRCRKSACIFSDWAECGLRQLTSQDGHNTSLYNTRISAPEVPVTKRAAGS